MLPVESGTAIRSPGIVMGDHYCKGCGEVDYCCVCDLRERALDYFTGGEGSGDALDGLKVGRRVDVRNGPLTKITHITSINHLDRLIALWDLKEEFDHDDACWHAMDKDD
jgi:hypothetical protein